MRFGGMRTLGIDLGGTKTALLLVDDAGSVLCRARRPSHEGGRALEPEALAAWARDTLRAQGLDWPDLDGVGVIVPGLYDPRTRRAWAPNLWGPDEVPLGDALSRHVPVPLAIDSDRSGYVLGEQWLGAARGAKDAVFLAVGTGIGAGILAGGRVVRGACGTAGAVGWLPVDPRWQPLYASVGCFEAEAAGPAIARRGGAARAEDTVAAARAGAAAALAAIAQTVEVLAMGIAGLIGVLNPEVVVLGGGVMQARDLFLEPIRAAVPRWAQPHAARLCRIEPSALGDDAGALGAARLAFPEVPRTP